MAFRSKTMAPSVEAFERRLLLARPAHSLSSAKPAFPATASESPPIPTSAAPTPTETAAAALRDQQVTDVTDPRVIKQGTTYYAFSSGPGIPVRSSTDLIHWRVVGRVFPSTPAWALAAVPGATSIWAPDISFYGGLYHLYYAVSTFGSQRSVIGLATNTTLDPTAPGYHWVDQGEVIASTPGRSHFNAIDPNLVIDPRTGTWLAFGSQWSGLKLLAINPATGKPPGPSTTLIPLASRPNKAPIEAPFIFHRGDFYYLFASFDLCCMGDASTYKVKVGRSHSVTGPYVDQSGRPMTQGGGTLVASSDGRYRGPGHNAVLTDGADDFLVYHAYDALNNGTPTLQIRPLTWTPSGWPVAGPPLF